ncbi:MAG: TrkA family potassium uptake protein [Clostridia bacterium]|nr:TrkA family potassium uptake protein [Clostridia bacterium]
MSKNKIEKQMKQFVVVGLGRFGRSVATKLSALGNEVLVIDTNPEAIKQIEDQVSSAVVADATGTDVLHSLGVQNFDCAINCIGDDLQANILTTLICKDLGVKYVVAKAKNEQNKRVLERVGADLVVFPEVVVGKKIASILSNPSLNEIMSLTDSHKIVEVAVPDTWVDKTILDLDVRKKYNVSIVFIKRQEEIVNPEPKTVLQKDDVLILAGHTSKLNEISKKTTSVLDANESMQDALDFE